MTIKFFGVIFVTAAIAARPQDAEEEGVAAASAASGLNMIQRGTQVSHQAELLAETEVAELKREIAQLKAELAPYRARRSKQVPDDAYQENYDPEDEVGSFGDYNEEDQKEFQEEFDDIFDKEMAKSGQAGRCGARIFANMQAALGGESTYGDAYWSFHSNCLFGPDAHNEALCIGGARALFAGYDYSKPFNNKPNSQFCKLLKMVLLTHNFWQDGPDDKGPPTENNEIPSGGQDTFGGGVSFYQEVLNKRIAERAARRQGKEGEQLDAAMGSKPAG